MKYYPIFLNLCDHQCVVVGGGAVAERKVKGLLASRAKVRLISPNLTPYLAHLVTNEEVTFERRCFQRGDLRGSLLVFAATNKRNVQKAIAQEAQREGVLLNSADDVDASDFLVPARLSRGKIQLAISTGGSSPALAKILRQQLDTLLEENALERLESLTQLRKQIKSQIPKQIDRAKNHQIRAGKIIKKKGKLNKDAV